MNKYFQNIALNATKAKKLFYIETIQSLWSGYGEIVRYGLQGSSYSSVMTQLI